MNKGFYYLAPAILMIAVVVAFIKVKPYHYEEKPERLISDIMQPSRFISADDVARLLIDKDPSLLLVDIRPSAEFNQFALNEAVNIPSDSLLAPNSLEYFKAGHNKVVLYGNGDIRSQMAWLELRKHGLDHVFVLKGGLNSWFSEIINPTIPSPASSQSEYDLYSFRRAAGNFFSGADEVPTVQDGAKKVEKKSVAPRPVKKEAAAEGGC